MLYTTFILGVWVSSAFPQIQGSISGTVSYRERIALPPNAEVVVVLDRFSKGTHTNLSEVTVRPDGRQVPIPFTVPYVLGTVRAGDRFVLRGEIRIGDDIKFRSESAVTVTLGSGRAVSLQLQRVEPGPSFQVVERTWELWSLEGKELSFKDRRPTIFLQAQDHHIRGFGGVNQFGGTFSGTGPQIQIDPGPMTLMVGPPERMEVESSFVNVLLLINRLTVENGELLLWRGDKERARFRAAKR